MQSKLTKYLNDNEKNKNNMIDDFEFFEKKLKRIFDVFNEKQTAEQVI